MISKVSLGHNHLHRLAVFKFDIDRQDSDPDFVKDALPSVSAFGNRNHAFACEGGPGADNRMARKRNLARGREDTQASQHFVRSGLSTKTVSERFISRAIFNI